MNEMGMGIPSSPAIVEQRHVGVFTSVMVKGSMMGMIIVFRTMVEGY